MVVIKTFLSTCRSLHRAGEATGFALISGFLVSASERHSEAGYCLPGIAGGSLASQIAASIVAASQMRVLFSRDTTA